MKTVYWTLYQSTEQRRVHGLKMFHQSNGLYVTQKVTALPTNHSPWRQKITCMQQQYTQYLHMMLQTVPNGMLSIISSHQHKGRHPVYYPLIWIFSQCCPNGRKIYEKTSSGAAGKATNVNVRNKKISGHWKRIETDKDVTTSDADEQSYANDKKTGENGRINYRPSTFYWRNTCKPLTLQLPSISIT